VDSKFNQLFEELLNKKFGVLEESLEFSYDIKQFKNKLYRDFGNNKIVEMEIDLNPAATYLMHPKKTGVPATLKMIVKDFDKNDEEKLKNLMQFFGYYVALENRMPETNEIEYQLEPTHGVEFKQDFWKIDKMFHTTPAENVEDILKWGLRYSETKTTFGHPGDRIFLFWTQSPEILRKWAQRLGKNKKVDSVSILEVALKPSYKMYLDDTATLRDIRKDFHSLLSVYTTSSISPLQIKLVDTIKV
jgi:hypothetical protein